MLRTLSIRNVVLIDRLDLGFEPGLSVLTGETGAGKSILLDALGLALGVRADARLLRHGAERASVTAGFDRAGGAVSALLDAHGIVGDEDMLLLRRVLERDGRSRAFVNDQPVSVALLRSVGEGLAEVHGQFESQRLLDAARHRNLLDAFGGLGGLRHEVERAYRAWRAAQATATQAAEEVAAARLDEEYLRHAVDELGALDPRPGQAEDLAGRRVLLMNAEKLVAAMNDAAGELAAGRGAEEALLGALRHLGRAAALAEGRLDAALAALERAASETVEAKALIERVSQDLDMDPARLEAVEERLFALRQLARKHGIDVDGLGALAERLRARLQTVEDGGARLQRLEGEAAAAREDYRAAAAALTEARAGAARRLDEAVAAELAPLKLEKAVFRTCVDPSPDSGWAEHGCDRVAFLVSANPGTPPGPLARIASGGELARFMLALKVVLAEADPVPTLVFDEVDSNVGGAVAAAVGERLARLADGGQVLVVTHSPQVAARGAHHWRVSKNAAQPSALTTVDPLGASDRTEEIARMLAGARVTDAARAAAESLLEGRRQ